MDEYSLKVGSPIKGGYFSTEQIDLLTIIQCRDSAELIDFIIHCDQINHVNGILESISGLDLETAKRKIFKSYQDTMILHDADKKVGIDNMLRHCGIQESDIEIIKNAVTNNSREIKSWLKEFIKNKYPDNYEKIFDMSHHFVSIERDQLKSEDLYDEMVLLNNNLGSFNSMLIGSGKIYNVVNDLYDKSNPDKRFDFYFAEKDLDFAFRNGKQVRYHSLLVKDEMDSLFVGKTKEEILGIIKAYVKKSIDFINEYNLNHKIEINGKEEPIINAVDLFNEIISFDSMIYDNATKQWCPYKRNKTGEYKVILNEDMELYRDLYPGEIPEYKNIWDIKYGISMPELMSCFDYAFKNKPEGVNFLYNEPFLENDKRRNKVFETLDAIDSLRPGLIDTLGSQMHITITQNTESIKKCFQDFKTLQDTKGKNIQITEFDMSLGKSDVERVFGKNADATLEQAYQLKDQRINEISNIINTSGVRLSGVSYWSLTDGIDCNLERLRTNELKKDDSSQRIQIPTACGGLIPTHKNLIHQNQLNQMMNTPQSNESSQKIHMQK